MQSGIVIIGDGHLATMLLSFPGVLGYVKPKDLETLYGKNGAELGRVNWELHRGVVGIANPHFREESEREWLAKGGQLGVLIHPTATIFGDPEIGPGTVMLPYAYIDDNCRIGRSVYIGVHSAIHKSVIGDYAHLTFGCRVIMAEIKKGAILGSGTVVLDGRTIGEGAIVGAGSVVYKDIPAHFKSIQKVEEILKPIEPDFIWTEEYFRNKENFSAGVKTGDSGTDNNG
jgi:acetyltransferase-like isoleucine patch superfamily enzyme